MQLPTYFYCGVILAIVLYTTRSVFASMAVHLLNNIATLLFDRFVYSVAENAEERGVLFSFILLCVLSASMSTLSSIVLTSSTSISVDLMSVLRKEKAPDEKKQMLITRLLCFAFIGLSLIFALFNFSIIVSIMSFSWGVVSGCFLGPYFWALYSKKTTRAGAWSGLLSGITVFAVYYILSLAVPAVKFDVAMCGVIAMAVSFVIVPVVSSFSKQLPEATIAKSFD